MAEVQILRAGDQAFVNAVLVLVLPVVQPTEDQKHARTVLVETLPAVNQHHPQIKALYDEVVKAIHDDADLTHLRMEASRFVKWRMAAAYDLFQQAGGE